MRSFECRLPRHPFFLKFFSALCLALPTPVFAARVVNFNAEASSTINDANVLSAVYPECQVTISNVSPNPESVQIDFFVYTKGPYANAGSYPAYKFIVLYNGGTIIDDEPNGATPPVSIKTNRQYNSGYITLNANGTAGDTVVIDWITYGIQPYGGASIGTQTLNCFGTITVSDVTTGSPGFVAASGSITTFNESTAGVSLGGTAPNSSGTANPSVTAIVIGEGRPF